MHEGGGEPLSQVSALGSNLTGVRLQGCPRGIFCQRQAQRALLRVLNCTLGAKWRPRIGQGSEGNCQSE